MIVTDISRRKGKAPRYALYVDGAYVFDVSEPLLLRYRLRAEQTIDNAMLESIQEAEALYQARSAAMNFISYRPRSSRELVDRLLKKGFPEAIAQQTAKHLETLKLVDDGQFARMFVRDKISRKPIGSVLLRRQLTAKGVAKQIIDDVIREYITEDDQQLAAVRLARTRIRRSQSSFAKLNRLQQKRRLFDYLLRHGFSNEIAMKTVRSVLPSR